MKICVAQTKPFTGDIQKNIDSHKKLIDLAVADGADAVIFPELSLTGYEPKLAKELATTKDDSRFDGLQEISNREQLVIGVGAPTKSKAGVCISMILFQPQKARRVYSKKYLHSDEQGFFVSGQNLSGLKVNGTEIALAICYELSVAEHTQRAFESGAKIYVASVAKFMNGIDRAINRLSEIAGSFSMTVLMANSVGQADGCECAGKTSIWNSNGSLLGQLNETAEGIIVFDADAQTVVERAQ
jgi:predicted amidohydrolase